MREINKKYDEIMYQADKAVGRKEVVRLLKKAARLKSFYDKDLAAKSFILNSKSLYKGL